MFNLSGSEIVVILLLALVVLGPEKLPDAIRRAGRTYAELKKMGNSFQAEMKSVLDEPMKEMRETADLLKKSVDFTDGALPTTGATSTPPGPPRLASAVEDPTDAATTDAPTTTDNADTTDDAPPARATTSETPSAEPAADTNDVGPTVSPTSAPAATNGEAAHPPAPQLSPEDELINRTLSGEQ